MATHIRNLWPLGKRSRYKIGSVVLVTGAGSGIGMNVALLYAQRPNVKLVLADIRAETLEPVATEARMLGAQVLAVPTDVTKPDDVKALMEATERQFGGLDVLVLCAGIAAHHIFSETEDLGLFHKLMNVNFFGYLHCTKYAYDMLCRSNGVLVAITSFSAEVGLPYRTAYCASKFAVTGFLEALRSEMEMLKTEGKSSFDITIVCPPTIDTNLRKNSLTPDPKHRTEKGESSLSVEDCAAAILDAADRRLRKAFFPWKSWLASYLRPLAPQLVDGAIRRKAAL